MIKYKIKHKIVNCENIDSVTSHDLYPPPLSQTVTLSQTPSPLEHDILYRQPLVTTELIFTLQNRNLGVIFDSNCASLRTIN